MGEAIQRVAGDGRHYLEAELEDRLRTDPEMWPFLLRSALDGLWYWDLERPDQEWMSPEFWQLFGIDPATRRHDPAEWQGMIFEDDLAVAMENLDRHCADPAHPYDQTVRYRHADGSTVWVRCRGLAIRDAAGRPIRMLGAHTDVTAIRRAAEEVREERAETARARADKRAIELAHAELRALVDAVSHGLKSPSSALETLMDELEEVHGGALNPDGRELLALGRRCVTRMATQIGDLATYSLMLDGPPLIGPVKLEHLVAEVIEELAGEIDAAGARLEIDPLPEIRADAGQLRLLMRHLIGNAVKFARPGAAPVVRVSSRQEAGRTVFEVADNGIGIADRHQGMIFSLFGRLHNDRDYPGSGLGLAICRRVAVNHGGDIGVRSAEGAGATFTVTLPATGGDNGPDPRTGLS